MAIAHGQRTLKSQLLDGHSKMKDLAGGSQSASDRIVRFKRTAVDKFKRFYREELLPAARERAKAQHRDDLLAALANETEPVMLLGGDEITVSLHKAFEELGLIPEAVGELTNASVANARVAVTHSGAGDGESGHIDAMENAQGGQDTLKKTFEPLARDLRAKAPHLPDARRAHAMALATRIDGMYTNEVRGQTQIVDANGTVVDGAGVKSAADALLEGR